LPTLGELLSIPRLGSLTPLFARSDLDVWNRALTAPASSWCHKAQQARRVLLLGDWDRCNQAVGYGACSH